MSPALVASAMHASSAVHATPDAELAIARPAARCCERDEAARCCGREADKAAVAAEIESLKRWCAAHVHDPALSRLGRVPLPREARLRPSGPDRSGPIRRCPRRSSGPTTKLRRRQGFVLTDPRFTRARGAERDSLLRAVPRARQGHLLEGHSRQGGKVTTNPLGIPLAGCPLDEKISEMHTGAQARRRHRRAGHRHRRQPDVPGHRPSHLQRLHEGLHLPEAGAGEHPAGRDRRAHRRAATCRGASRSTDCSRAGTRSTSHRPYALPYNGKNVLVVGLGPAGYTLSHYLLNEGFGVVAIDGLKIEPLPDDISGAAAATRRVRFATGARSTVRSTSACSRASAACPSTASPCAGTRTS